MLVTLCGLEEGRSQLLRAKQFISFLALLNPSENIGVSVPSTVEGSVGGLLDEFLFPGACPSAKGWQVGLPECTSHLTKYLMHRANQADLSAHPLPPGSVAER